MTARPSGAGAVMADRARGEVEGDDALAALHRKLEYFPTPPWAARAGAELIHDIEWALRPNTLKVWEPTCGGGHMAHGLGDYFDDVLATDIHSHGWAGQAAVLDFLSAEADATPPADWIAFNPPFGLAAEFIQAALRRARRGVAVLARSTFLESEARYKLLFGENPLAVYAPFVERVPMELGGWNPRGSTATAYAWFIFMTPRWREVFFGSDRPTIRPIRPGTRRRLTKPDDARLFGRQRPAPLFEGAP